MKRHLILNTGFACGASSAVGLDDNPARFLSHPESKLCRTCVRIARRLTGARATTEDSRKTRDVLGRCFGFRVIRRSKKDQGTDSPLAQILIEDDENWIPKDVVFDVYWLNDLIATAIELKAALETSEACPPRMFESDAQIRALQFVRNLNGPAIDKVIADLRAGKVQL